MLGTTQEYFEEMEKLKQYEVLGTVEELSTRVKEEDILKLLGFGGLAVGGGSILLKLAGNFNTLSKFLFVDFFSKLAINF